MADENDLEDLMQDLDGDGGSLAASDSSEAEVKKPAAKKPAAKKPAAKKPAAKTTRIVLEENDDIPPTGLPVAINGRAYIIRPGEEVDVPDNVLEVLDNARMDRPVVDPSTKRVVSYRSRMRYPYRRVR